MDEEEDEEEDEEDSFGTRASITFCALLDFDSCSSFSICSATLAHMEFSPASLSLFSFVVLRSMMLAYVAMQSSGSNILPMFWSSSSIFASCLIC